MMDRFPKELLMAFGMVNMDWSTILGFFALIFLFVQICLAIQAANYGFGLVSIEENEWTADFLLTKPVGRGGIMTSKLLAALTGLTITNAVVWIVSFICLMAIFANGQEWSMQGVGDAAAQHHRIPVILPDGGDGHLAAREAGAQRDTLLDGAGLWAVHPECIRLR